MNRRDTVLALLALSASPFAVQAQQPSKPARVAMLGFSNPELGAFVVDALKRGLRELGYVEGKNLVFEVRWAYGRAERLPDLAREVVALNPDVIVASGTQNTLAAQKATATIPIVASNPSDPVGAGLAASLARPGGNITGFTYMQSDVSPKLIELLLTAVPKLVRAAVLWNPSSRTPVTYLNNILSAAQRAKLNILTLEVQTPSDVEKAFERMIRDKIRAVIVPGDNFYLQQRRQLAELALKNRIPSVFVFREHVEEGGLMSYGQNLVEGWRYVATYVDKILKGAKPGDLPFEQSRALELVVNLKTAKALGITIPKELLLRADAVIE